MSGEPVGGAGLGRWARAARWGGWHALVAVAGGALYLAFPPHGLWWTAIPAFAALWTALRGVRARRAFGLGLTFGLAFFLPHLLWLNDFLGREYGVGPWLLLCAVMGLYSAAACAFVPLVSRLPAAPVWGALLFVLQETLRGLAPFNGFPWGRVAFGQVDGPFLALAALGGAPLVSFAVVVTGFGLASFATAPRRLGHAWVVVPLVAALATAPLVGTAAQEGERKIAVIQGNAPDIGLGLLYARDTLRANHLGAAAELADRVRSGELPKPDLVVWPESSVSVGADDLGVDLAVRELGVPNLVGAVRRVDGKQQNAIVDWDPVEGPGEVYAKQELVPFAEHIPVRDLARIITPFADTPDMDAGGEPGLFDVAGTRIGLGICYELAYDYVLRESAAQGAQLIVAPTNNAWYGPGEMTYQQLGMARLRAVEHGRAVVVAAISGVSAVVRPDGTVAESTGMFTEDLMVADVPLRSSVTVATRIGGVLGGLFTIAALGAIAAGAWLARRERGAAAVERVDEPVPTP